MCLLSGCRELNLTLNLFSRRGYRYLVVITARLQYKGTQLPYVISVTPKILYMQALLFLLSFLYLYCPSLPTPSPWNLGSLLLLCHGTASLVAFSFSCCLFPFLLLTASSWSCRDNELYHLTVVGALLVALSPCHALAVRVAPWVSQVYVVLSKL